MQPVDSTKPVVVREPDASKGARPVLWGGWGREVLSLPSKRFPLAAGVVLLALAQAALAQAGPRPAPAPAPAETPADTPSIATALDAELFYQLLLGEINARGTEAAAGYSLVLDAARKTNDPALYQRAVDIAFQARSGDSALQAARAWKEAHPQSREANRYVLQILVALNRINDSAEPLKTDLALTPPQERAAVLSLLPRVYSRVSDKKLAATVVEQALAEYLSQPATAAPAWTALGRLRLAAGDHPGALDAARRGQAAAPTAEGPVLLALELMDPKLPQAEPIVRKYIDGKPLPELRMAYARALLDAQRYAEAAQQLQVVTAEKPDYPEAWLVQGTLQLQDNRDAAAEASLKRYIELAQAQRSGEERGRGLAQAYLSLSRIAEKRKDYTLAGAWLDKIENPQDLVAAQNRRASILARQGKLEEGRKLLRALPERTPEDAAMKLSAEVQLLRDNKQYKAAYDLMAQANAKPPIRRRPGVRAGDAGREDGQPARDGAAAAAGDRGQARLPPRLQRPGLFTGRSQPAAARSQGADPEGADVRPRRPVHQRQPRMGGVPHGQQGGGAAHPRHRLQDPARRGNRGAPGRGSVEPRPA